MPEPPRRACPLCTAPAEERDRFCRECGAALAGVSEDRTRTSVPEPTALPNAARRTSAAGVSFHSQGLDDSRFVPGEMVAGRYRIVGLLGRGGMGEVYRADDLKLGQPVALKFLPSRLERDPDRLQRFLAEARTARQIAHPNVCRVFDVGDVDGQHFLSMEYVDGEDLGSLLLRIGHIPNDRAVQIARQLCAGLAAAHSQGFLHRDLKPSNVMIDGRGRVRIMDFGLAGLAESFRDREIRVGTPAYMAPEQLRGDEVTVRSDLYALGLVLYEMFTGRRAFEADSPAELMRLQTETTPAAPSTQVLGVDPRVEHVVFRCLETDPSRRPASALGVAAALPGGDALTAALAAGDTPSPEMVAAAGGTGVVPTWKALAAAALAVAAVAVGTAIRDRSSVFAHLPSELSAEVLRNEARKIAVRLGHEPRNADSAHGFGFERDYFDFVERDDRAAERWNALATVRPMPAFFWYRESDSAMVSSATPPWIGWNDPPNTQPGMTNVVLDLQGRLLTFRAQPRSPAVEPGPYPEPDWTIALEAAGLDASRATAVEPRWFLRVAGDVRRAWEAPYRDRPEIVARAEAAAAAGRISAFEVVAPWSRGDTGEAPAMTGAQIAANAILVVLLAAVLIGAVVLARRNVRLGRGDRRGAWRVATAIGGLYLLGWLAGSDHVPSFAEVAIILDGLAWSMLWGVMVAVGYLALEPYIRRLWPDTVVSWSRLLEGRWRDALLGRDVLIGTTVGCLLASLGVLGAEVAQRFVVPAPRPELPTPIWMVGAPKALGATALLVVNGPVIAFSLLMLIVLLRMILRRKRVAALALWAVLATVGIMTQVDTSWIGGVTNAVVWAAIILVATRHGLVATAALVIALNLVSLALPALSHPGWYTPESLLLLAVPAVLLGYGVVTALGGRTILQDELLAR